MQDRRAAGQSQLVRALQMFGISAALLLGLPMLGLLLTGRPISRHLELPPRTGYVPHAPFSWHVFGLIAALTLLWLTPLLVHWLRWWRQNRQRLAALPRRRRLPFPWWGWCGLGLGLLAWVAAWQRFELLAPVQSYTFTPLWLAFILTVNALTLRRSGRCLLIHRPRFFLLLFPASTLFWWFFEYLNRFVQNWSYIDIPHGSVEYVIFATLPFSTVLPAVLSTRELLTTFPAFYGAFADFAKMRPWPRKKAGFVAIAVAGAGLSCIGLFPDQLFPLLWLSPLIILLSLQAIGGGRHVLSSLAQGDWRVVISAMAAALICGVFWEMWNYFSQSKWIYSVPYVQRFQIFEMPLLGFAGYLPFGIECVQIGHVVRPGHTDEVAESLPARAEALPVALPDTLPEALPEAQPRAGLCCSSIPPPAYSSSP